jgi:hypothetical protein
MQKNGRPEKNYPVSMPVNEPLILSSPAEFWGAFAAILPPKVAVDGALILSNSLPRSEVSRAFRPVALPITR